jgi:hypothetical protein
VTPLKLTAIHEAAHAVVLYRTAGFADCLKLAPSDDNLGAAIDTGLINSACAEDREARIVSCYAGGHAQRRADPASGTDGCDVDEEIAADLLRQWGWHWGWSEREQELRQRSADLVEERWVEIQAVAVELLQRQTLDATEVELIADAASESHKNTE